MASEAGAIAASSSTAVALQQLDLDYEVATFEQLTEVVEGPLSAVCGDFKRHALEMSGVKKQVEGLNITGLQFEGEREVVFATPAHGRHAMFLDVTNHLGNVVRALESYKIVSDDVPSIGETLAKMGPMLARLKNIEDTAKTDLDTLAGKVTLMRQRLETLQSKLGNGLVKGGELYQTASWICTYMNNTACHFQGQTLEDALTDLAQVKAEQGPFETRPFILPGRVTFPLGVEDKSADDVYNACQNAFGSIYGRGMQHLTLLGVAKKDLQQSQEANTPIQFLEMDEEGNVSLKEASLTDHLTRLLAYIGFAKDEGRHEAYAGLLRELRAAHNKLKDLEGYEEKTAILDRQIGLVDAMRSSFGKEISETYELARSFYGIAHPSEMSRGLSLGLSVTDKKLDAAIAKAVREHNEVNEEESA